MPTTILVSDDETHVTHILALKLGAAGHHVLVARNGQDALEQATAARPDLVITDFQMPLMTGFEMAMRLKDDPATRNIPLIMLTARGHKLTQDELAQTHIVALMDKPFSVSALARQVEATLAGAKPNTSPGSEAAA